MTRLLLLLSLFACKAPPITQGKCVTLAYEGTTPTKRVCIYEGYRWDCSEKSCVNVGEAKGER